MGHKASKYVGKDEGEEIQEERVKRKEKGEKKRRKEDTRQRKGNILTRSLVRLRHALSTPNLAPSSTNGNSSPEPSPANSSPELERANSCSEISRANPRPETSRAYLNSKPNIIILDSEPSTANSSPETSRAHLDSEPNITILDSEPSTANSSPGPRRHNSSPETSKAHLVSNPSITILSPEPSTANPSLITAHLIPEPSTINQCQFEENEGFNLSASPPSVGNVSPPPTMTNLIFEPTVGNLSPKPTTAVLSPTLTTVNLSPTITTVNSSPTITTVSSSPTITTVNSSPLPTIASLNPGPIATRPRLRPLVKIGGRLDSASPISRPIRAKPIPKYITTNLPPRPTTAKLSTKYTTSNPIRKPATANLSIRQWVMIGGIKISVVEGQLIDEQVDVYVNGVPSSFDLSKIPSKKLSDAAGPALEADCKKRFPNGLKIGDIADTGGFNSKCQRVYHVTLPRSQQDGSQNKILTQSVKDCLERANKNSFSSIAVPDLGSPIGYPHSILADLMFTAVEEFSKGKSNPNLSLVVFSIFKNQVYTAFVNKAKEISRQKSVVVSQKKKFKFGRVEVWLEVGDITQQHVDVIVCSGPKDLKLKNKGMAETMLMAAGPKLQKDCDDKYPNGIKHGDIAITGGHDLHCRFVYIGALPKWGTSTKANQILKDLVINCLDEANKHPMTKTLAFPTLGTGSLEYPPDEVAEVMAECIKDFNKKYPKTELTRITIVAYSMDQKLQTVQQAFRSSLQITTPTRPVSSKTASSSKPLNSKQYFEDLYHKKPMPPSYWTKYTSSKTLADWNTTVSQKAHEQVDLNPSNPIYKAIKKLALTTWKSQYVGQGVDSFGLAGLNYTNIRITGIKRLENPHLFEEYWKYREKLFLRASQKGVLKPLPQISQAINGEVLTTKMADPSLKMEIYPGINEHYLFHGTEKKYVQNILTQGLDGRLANSPFFGKGVYCAESSTKSDQYADPIHNRDLQEKQMLLVRACLGEIFVRTDTTTKHSYTRPPCQRCYKDRCTDVTHSSLFFDSIVVDGGWNFREFILYDNKACYPEYLISYRI
ncbi:uncharacterized protein LOC134269645 isoform X2 [Saccostrea cucullata]|uniref:uncharacterized protein LOC134269645 isoform X2 n=1 Tax=Saccostrea cuccullata TaxID=36930 RepID=UPI002ED66807